MNVMTTAAPYGSGGSMGKGSDTEAKNTLRSKSVARILDVLGEGTLRLADGEKSIFFDNVPLKSDDDTYNFQGVSWAFRSGTAGQSSLPGFSAVETEVVYGAEVKKHQPVTRSISNPDCTAARVTIRIPALAYQPKDKALKASSVQYRIEVRADGGAWTDPFGDITITGKCTAPYDRSYRLALPMNSGTVSYPWEIRVTRLSNDSNDQNDNQIPDDTETAIETRNENQTYLQAITEIVEHKLSYPYTALIGLIFDAKKFGGNVPNRGYEVVRTSGRVPSNYNPVTRGYTGIWDGTFKIAENDNPAWALYDILSSKLFGLGRELSAPALAAVKWDLYEIGRYCDQMIPDGFGGTEPRMTFNGVIKSQKEAYDLIAMLASVFRGMTYWSSGGIRAVADQPSDPVVLAHPGNVIDGDFSYTGTSRKSRNTVIHVSWNDPDDLYRPATEVVEDAAGVKRFGRRVKEVAAVGCTSRGQARRLGLWTLATELGEDQIVTYRAGFDHAFVSTGHPGVVPGDVVAIQDPSIAGLDWSGRLLAGSDTDTLVLDRPVTLSGATTNSVTIRTAAGSLLSRTITTTGTVSTLQLATALPSAPEAGASWVISSTALAPKPFRVVSVAEVDKHIFEVKALFNDTTKYARVDNGVTLKRRTYTKITTAIGKPVNLDVREYQFIEDGAAHSKITVSWSAPSIGTAVAYHPVIEGPAGEIDLGEISGTSFDITDAVAGDYVFNIASVAYSGKESGFATALYTAIGWTGSTQPEVSGLALVGGDTSTTFSGRDVALKWVNTLSSGGSAGNPFYLDNVLTITDSSDGTVLREESVRGEAWTYPFDINRKDAIAKGKAGAVRTLGFSIVCRDTLGRESDPATLTVSNPVPAAITPTLQGTNEQIFISWTAPADRDFAGVLAWVGTSSGFTPGAGNLVYDGPDSGTSIPKAYGTYWVVIAAYDAFGKTGLNLSSPTPVVVSKIVDIDPPAVPTGLALTPTLARAADGTITTKLVATVDASPSDNFAYFDFEIMAAGGSYVAFSSSTPRYEWTGLTIAGGYSVRVRSVSKAGAPSAYCTVAATTIPSNTTAPTAPTGLSAAASFQNVFLAWTNPGDTDLAAIEIWENTTNTQPNPSTQGSLKVGTVAGTRFTRPLATGMTRYYWIRAVNTSGLTSGFNATSGVSATTAGIGSGDILDAAVTATKFASGIEPVTNITGSLPTTLSTTVITFGGKLYRWNGTAYIASVATSDLTGTVSDAQIAGLAASKVTGQLSDTQLAALSAAKITGQLTDAQLAAIAAAKITGTLGTTQIGDGVVTDAKIVGMAASKITGQLTDAQLAAIATAKLTGQITSTQITDGAISTPKLAAGSVTAAQIAADTIVAGNIAAGAVTAAEIAAGAVTTAKLAAGAVTANEIAADTITASQIAANAVTSNELAAGSVVAGKIAAGTIVATDIAAGAVTTGKLAAAAVTANELAAGSVVAGKIAADAVTANEIAANAITAAEIAAGAVTTAKLAAGAVTANEIAAATITGAKIAAGTIAAGNIAADTITAAQIAAGAISASELAAGAITADKLAVGTSKNWIENSDFSADWTGWAYEWSNDPTQFGAYIRTDGYCPHGGAIEIYQITGNQIVYGINPIGIDGGPRFHSVIPGKWYEMSSYYYGHRCNGLGICIGWLGINGTVLGYSIVNSAAAVQNDYVNYDASRYQRVWQKAQAPAGAVKAYVFFRHLGTFPGNSDSYLWIYRPLFGMATANQVDPSDWSPAGVTMIQGGNIVTGAVTASKIAAGTITADKIQAATITGDRLAAGTITGDKVAANTIDASKINISGATTLASWKNGTDATKIEGGSIAANTITANKLKIGARGLNILGIDFQTNASANSISWSSGYVGWIDDNGTLQASAIPASSVAWSGWVTIYWVKGATTLSFCNDSNGGWNAYSGNADAVPLAFYWGGAAVNVIYGGTIIDGTRITTGTVTATQIAAGAIVADKIGAGAITADKIAAGAVTATKLLIGNSDNIIPDGDMRDETWWVGADRSNVSLIDTDGGWTDRRALALDAGNFDYYSSYFPVEPGATYKISVRIWNYGGTWSGWFAPLIHMPNWQWFSLHHGFGVNPGLTTDAAHVMLAQQDGTHTWTVTNATGISGNANRAWQFRFTGNWTGSPVVITVRITRVSDNTLIQDGAITTNKITARTITADRIAVGALTATEIAANAITADKINVIALSSITANVGTVTAGVIQSPDGLMKVDLNNSRILIGD